MAQTTTKLTYEDYLLIPDDGLRHEVIDGEHYVNAAPVPRHQIVLGRIYHRLAAHVEERDLGMVFVAPTDNILGAHDIVQPDIFYVSNARAAIVRATNIDGASDLVVEVLSPGNRTHDQVRKRRLYERAGVSEYWIIDPIANTVQILRRGSLGFVVAAELTANDALTTPLLPELSIPLARVFREWP